MAKQLRKDDGQVVDIETEFTEHGVEYEIDGETFVSVAENEVEARNYAGLVSGQVVVRTVYETAWALAEDGD